MTHRYIIGQSGTGKSTFALNCAIDDICSGKGVTFIDPHGQTARALLDYIPEHRIAHTTYFDPSDRIYAPAYNPLQGGDHKVADDITSGFRSFFGDSWGPRLEYVLRNCLHTLTYREHADLLGVRLLLRKRTFREQCMSLIKDQNPILYDFWADEFEEYVESRDYAKEIASPILNKIMPLLGSPDTKHVLCQDSIIKPREIMDTSGILIINLAKGKIGETYANMLGKLVVAGISQAALSREDIEEELRVPHHLYVDEAQNVATDAFSVVLSEARKYRLHLTISHQYVDQLPDTFRSAIFGNISHDTIVFRVGYLDAPLIAKQIGWPNSDTLAQLPNYHYLARHEHPAPTNSGIHQLKSEKLPPVTRSYADEIIRNSQSRASRLRREVEHEIRQFLDSRAR